MTEELKQFDFLQNVVVKTPEPFTGVVISDMIQRNDYIALHIYKVITSFGTIIEIPYQLLEPIEVEVDDTMEEEIRCSGEAEVFGEFKPLTDERLADYIKEYGEDEAAMEMFISSAPIAGRFVKTDQTDFGEALNVAKEIPFAVKQNDIVLLTLK